MEPKSVGSFSGSVVRVIPLGERRIVSQSPLSGFKPEGGQTDSSPYLKNPMFDGSALYRDLSNDELGKASTPIYDRLICCQIARSIYWQIGISNLPLGPLEYIAYELHFKPGSELREKVIEVLLGAGIRPASRSLNFKVAQCVRTLFENGGEIYSEGVLRIIEAELAVRTSKIGV